jgi:DNA-binding NarL/FixJ family response regulator
LNNNNVIVILTPTGVGARPLPSLNLAIQWLLEQLYAGIPLLQTPVTHKHISLSERNQQICNRYAMGETLKELAQEFGLSHQRVDQIIHRWC